MTAIETFIARIQPLMGNRISTNATVRQHHAHGEGWQSPDPAAQPDVVVFARTTEEVAAIVSACHDLYLPVIPFGGGTSLEGQLTATKGGVSLDLSQMNAIPDIRPQDLSCRVQAGVTRQQLNGLLRSDGLFFAVDPGGEATLGGMCATRASGTGAVRYGTMRENVLGLTAVMADGKIIQTGGNVRKSATGYDLTGLLIGSEGTLGIITEIQARLHPLPETILGATCQFSTLADAVDTATSIIQAGLPIGRLELLDDVQMDACIRYSSLEGYRPLPTLFFELHASPASVTEQADLLREITEYHNGLSFRASASPEERTRLWKARHDAFWACMAYRQGHKGMTTDAVVPISAMTDMITLAKQDIEESGLVAPIVGHVGDGNFHTVILIPPEPDGWARAQALDHKIIQRALDLGGSISGEHGIGIAKQMFMHNQHGNDAIMVMHAIKRALDPRNILNPGMLLPAAVSP
ncbi:D-lactate dehydrogenase/oxidoreductase [Komagataeibacter europaeus NBRC 3261]|uniref:D-lactate dehydrogenase (cytochrome) n=1 Tax=Komagataeibacter europaeus NBRC 3261 TaxID=1234669 RepID=A0A0D6Q3D4_KOMEU|nr:FAD-linked oxidase C-terminal domain-containing protein [Komagataeibacter europaeus]GAN97954.1 D-lactate dehydrogenase/oxidoreductase [Komagataeibacter europaeus NBRC 3261]